MASLRILWDKEHGHELPNGCPESVQTRFHRLHPARGAGGHRRDRGADCGAAAGLGGGAAHLVHGQVAEQHEADRDLDAAVLGRQSRDHRPQPI